ncbi:hypothetical protein [Hymenobacter metallicola]|uniref:Uncharacterized protein n=1 Tax=Hymenobacter metallicola TaxID=2563114 RepID=A0A4Z0QHE6_9BACT|nr:hypothetical protein [Hymenobacter metallicola]TGE28729.1 hypothetical protein E5K02_04490 [Hymenobacter metallicola]
MKKNLNYFQVRLEVALPTSEYVFGFINISHILYSKLTEIFHEQLVEFKQRFLFDDIGGYVIDESLYQKHKPYFDQEIPFNFDFTLFQYSVSICSVKRSDRKKSYHKHQPPLLPLSEASLT